MTNLRGTAKKTRNPEATKAAILDAAETAFSAASFQGVNLRAIAKKAKIDVALINRYFGSKVGLFEEILNRAHTNSQLLQGVTRENLIDVLLPFQENEAAVVEKLSLLNIGAYSLADPEVRLIIQKSSMKYFVKPLIKIIGGPDAVYKALLITSTLMGYTMSQQFVFSEPFKKTSAKHRHFLKELIQSILDK